MGSQLSNQWLSLAEYSSKYCVSISTLRRRIRAGQLSFSLKFGKYFLKDQSPVSLKKIKVYKADNQKKYSQDEKQNVSELKSSDKALSVPKTADKELFVKGPGNTKKASPVSLPESSLFNKLMESQKAFHRQIEQREMKINELQDKVMDLSTLVTLLEKENKELKALLHQEKEMEEWLELK